LLHARAICFAAASFPAKLRCLNAIEVRRCSNAVKRGTGYFAQLCHQSAAAAALAIAGLSTTGAFAACMSCLLCRGLLSCAATVLERDQDAWVQRRCPVGCMLRAQLPLDSQVWRRWQLPN